MTTTMWYADGLRWIGSLFNDAAARLERNAEEPLDPTAYRDIERYVDELRSRVHIQI